MALPYQCIVLLMLFPQELKRSKSKQPLLDRLHLHIILYNINIYIYNIHIYIIYIFFLPFRSSLWRSCYIQPSAEAGSQA